MTLPALFYDSDVLIDVLAKREPFFEASFAVLSLSESGAVRGLTSPLVLANVFYVLKKFGGKVVAEHQIRRLRGLLSIAPLEEGSVDQALASRLPDFEDALQIFCAQAGGSNAIVTRNIDDFTNDWVPVFRPVEAWATFHR
jgi:predicted nucleic acid-binding protein